MYMLIYGKVNRKPSTPNIQHPSP